MGIHVGGYSEADVFDKSCRGGMTVTQLLRQRHRFGKKIIILSALVLLLQLIYTTKKLCLKESVR
jgi:hypothetical protein